MSTPERVRLRSILPILAMIASLLLSGGGAPQVAAQAPQPQERPPGEWVHLGPSGTFNTNSFTFAVSPQWPADRFIVATSGSIMRSADGGKTWDRVNAPQVGVGSLVVAPPTSGGRIVFAIGASGLGTGSGFGIARSADGGETWSTALSVAAARSTPRSLRLSPSFADDGIALAVHDGILYRSQDFGATWASTYPSGNQRVQQIEFSPAFAVDRTLVAALVTGTFPVPWELESDTRRAAHHETSASVAISTDRGDTWQVSSTGLEINGTPYRYVRAVALSPTFAEDGVMFAFAWGPWDGNAVPAALFRSADRGQTWAPVWQSDPGKDGLQWSATFALSPAFGADGVGQIAMPGLSSWNAGPHGVGPCPVYTTVDHGQTWALVLGRDARSPGCFELRLALGGPIGRIAYSTDHPGEGAPRSKFRSFDDGATWELICPPVWNPGSGTWPSAVARDGTYFVATQSGIWALGAGARPAPAPTASAEPPGDAR